MTWGPNFDFSVSGFLKFWTSLIFLNYSCLASYLCFEANIYIYIICIIEALRKRYYIQNVTTRNGTDFQNEINWTFILMYC